MSEPMWDDDTAHSPSLYLTGYCSPIVAEQPEDIVARLHAVIKEVTGKDVEVPPKARIGFLP